VVAVPVGKIPPSQRSENAGNTCYFKLVHEPIRRDDPATGDFENYGHTEVRVFKNAECSDGQEYLKNSALPKTAKMEFRQKLADESRIAIGPNSQDPWRGEAAPYALPSPVTPKLKPQRMDAGGNAGRR
jgi:hypothetical protein